MSGTSAGGVRSFSDRRQDCQQSVSGSLPKMSGSLPIDVRIVTEDVRIVTQRVRIVSGESGASEVSLSKAGKRCQERYLDPSQDCWKTAELIGGASGTLPVSVRIVTYERQDRYPGCQDRYR